MHGVVVSRVPWAEPGIRFTRDFEMECTWLMTVANRKTVSGFLHVAWRTAGDIAGRVVGRLESGMPCMFDGLTAIGVDETSHRKGHTYITVVVDHEHKRVIWAHDGYGKQVLDLFFEELTPEQRASIRIVTGDGARWIDSSVAGYCPNAERVPDSFHIVSWMTDCLDRVRKRLWNQARRAKDKTAAEAMKGLKYAVLGNPGDLTERQSTALATLAGKPRGNSNDGSTGPATRASPRSSNYAGRSAGAGTASSGPSDSATPTRAWRRSTTGSKSPYAWPTASTTSTTSSP